MPHLKPISMKTYILLLWISLAVFTSVSAQPFKPHVRAYAGKGLFPTYLKDHSKMKFIPLTAGVDCHLSRHFSLGLSAAHSVTESGLQQFRPGFQAQWDNHFTVVALRFSGQSRMLAERWQVYGGMLAGLTMTRIAMIEGEVEKLREERGIDQQVVNPLYTAFLGARYDFNPRVGGYLELGLGASVLTMGASMRIGKLPKRR